MYKVIVGTVSMLMISATQAAMPLWTFTLAPGSQPTQTLQVNSTATVQYAVQNQSGKPKRLVMQSMQGVVQSTPCQLAPKGQAGSSCTLILTITGSALPASGAHGGPRLCQANSDGSPNPNQCYQPSAANILNISRGPAAEITVSPSTLRFGAGSTGSVMVTNSTLSVESAKNVAATIPAGSNISVQSSTCPVSLAPGSNCIITFAATMRENPTTIVIAGDNTNAVNVVITVGNTFAYIANDFNTGANNITRCKISAINGDLTECMIVGADFNDPAGLTFNANASRVYITNVGADPGDDNVSICDIADNGLLNNCSNSGTGMNAPGGILLNPTGTRIYIVNSGTNNVTRCDIVENGNLDNCSNSPPLFDNPVGIAFNIAGTKAYVTNFGAPAGANNVTSCDIVEIGVLNNCSNSGDEINHPIGIVFNAAGTKVYVVNGPNFAAGSVTKCHLASNGDLTNCALAGNTGNTSRFMVFNADETLAYITNAADDNVSKCAVDGNGDLVNCTTTGANMNGATGIQLVVQ